MAEIGIIVAIAYLAVAGIIIFWIWVMVTLAESIRRWSYARETEADAYSRWVDWKIYRERGYFDGDERDTDRD